MRQWLSIFVKLVNTTIIFVIFKFAVQIFLSVTFPWKSYSFFSNASEKGGVEREFSNPAVPNMAGNVAEDPNMVTWAQYLKEDNEQASSSGDEDDFRGDSLNDADWDGQGRGIDPGAL